MASRTQAPMPQARELGSARTGSRHWRLQRVTAVALVPLTVWFVISFAVLIDADHRTYSQWIAAPLNAALMIALIVILFYHMALGLQVIAEDYLHLTHIKLLAVVSIHLGSVGLAIVGFVAVMRMLT